MQKCDLEEEEEMKNMQPVSLDHITMNVIETSRNGVVNKDTIFNFAQRTNIVTAEYRGGKIVKGFLIGVNEYGHLRFSYCQLQTDGKLDTGTSYCDLSITDKGKIRMKEHFEWSSREGENGINIFEEL